MKKIFKQFYFLLFIPLGMVIGLISSNNKNGSAIKYGKSTMTGSFSFYAYSFLGIYLCVIFALITLITNSNIEKKYKKMIFTIVVLISILVILIASLFI